MNSLLILFLSAVSVLAQAKSSDLYGYSSNSTNLYKVENTEKAEIYSVQQNEMNQILLTADQGVVQDIFKRVTWFDAAGKKIVSQVPGSEFKLSQTLLGTYTPSSFAAVYNREGKTVFTTNRPVSGLAVANHRFAWIDQWRESLELYDLQGKMIFNRNFVKNAWLSDSFLVLKNDTRVLLFGRDQKLFPTETSAEVQISNQLAVLTTTDGRTKVYSPDRWLFTRAGIKKVVLTDHYLALIDAKGMDVFRNDGSFAARYLLGTKLNFGNRAILIHQATGTALLIDPTPASNPRTAVIPRVGSLVFGAKLALVLNGYFYEVYSLDAANFGARIAKGDRMIDAQAQSSVGLQLFGFVNPNAKSAQIFAPGGVGTMEARTVLDQTFVNRLDLSVEAPSLNWTKF